MRASDGPTADERRTAARVIAWATLGVAAPLIATGCAKVDDVGEPGSAATESPPAQDRAEGATAGLADGERLFQGAWQLYLYESGSHQGTLRIDSRDFHADSIHGEYDGSVTIRSETSPPQIDFTIEECSGCNHEGRTSTGIYYVEDDGAIVFAGSVPGDPRPEGFTTTKELWRMRPLDPATEGALDAEPRGP